MFLYFYFSICTVQLNLLLFSMNGFIDDVEECGGVGGVAGMTSLIYCVQLADSR